MSDESFEIDSRELELKERVGTGCTAEVYRGIYKKTNQVVAIKQIDWNKSSMQAKDQVAFDREVAIMPRVSHPNLVGFVGVTSLERPFRIITEFCSGGVAFELLHNSDHIDISWKQKLKMCLDVASAMQYLHQFEPQIIHRDLKSLNLLLKDYVRRLSDVPVIKVSDFGLSRIKDTTSDDWGKMTTAAGTCHWMAPEVIYGQTYNEKVDVYSFAMILFEIMCREIPFEDEEPANVGRLVYAGKRADLEAVPPDTPKGMEALMVSCWAHDPKSRPSFTDVLGALEDVDKTL